MNPKLFLADDNPFDAMLLDLGFTEAGLQVEIVQARDGAQALAMLRSVSTAKPFPFGLIVIDINMPVVNGLELLEKLNGMPELNGVFKVIMTTSINPRDRDRSLRLKPTAFMIKPDGYNDLAGVISALVPYLFPGSGRDEADHHPITPVLD